MYFWERLLIDISIFFYIYWESTINLCDYNDVEEDVLENIDDWH
jgi:hypothetical protein